ncbi:MAG: DUF401 family protein [Thermodesulfovibrionales bacterium]|nr:DUF401 family protein [Thermodesulfovibrionales bacterium]
MSDILKISAVFIFILILLRKKLNVGYVMLMASGLLGFLYLMPPQAIFSTIKNAFIDKVTIKLALALTMIKSFELILREKDVLSDMMKASKALLLKKKAVIVSMPVLIGLLPSIGGAYFSAPMVDESTKGMKMSQEEKAFINYWFRHPWEYILPLYPGILLAAAVSGMELRDLIIANTAYAFFIVITGLIFSMRNASGAFPVAEGVSKKGLLSFIPIALVLLLVVIFHLELHYALLLVIIALFIFYRFNARDVIRVLKHGLSMDVIVLIIGIMLFKETMEASGAVKNLSGFLTSKGIPFTPIIFLLPFATGLLTGITVGFVGSTFPLIMSIAGGPSIGVISFAFASGFLGVLLSPVHICLVLTREYFKADMWGVYKKIIPAGSIVFLVAVVEYLILK